MHDPKDRRSEVLGSPYIVRVLRLETLDKEAVWHDRCSSLVSMSAAASAVILPLRMSTDSRRERDRRQPRALKFP